MNQNDLRPAYLFAQCYGVKSLVFGPPGVGKTPIINTAPRPVLCVTEPGMLSMRNSSVPTWAAFDAKRIDEFFLWLFGSAEVRNFDTVCVDSMSQMAEIVISDEQKNNRHGLKAYGEMSRRVMEHLSRLYFMQYKHTYLVCKQTSVDVQGIRMLRPFFPGQDLNVKVPHMYDMILHCAYASVPNVGTVKAFRTRQAIDIMARDRSGLLNEFEQCDLAALFAKAMS